ncbi:TetR family transcriptional regulator [Amycolatopsis sp. PS_44_ISF1]|uniref:TetR family transcriptional regulator n=1 Tax=Amycolatopsis sp. PS_44_ISF1 TaxID=2974917 RepID=UPI0028DF6198|nr:TetR family transcriptional regulator [Amycolatopsis sp. PS_44_ISF1]MDT8912939.1 TetR family transcriptional regulator [Amycolatopsis sp. PS_44_ISF1]
MPPDATATKARILEAALREFAQHGLAGARVDRIAESAAANKRSLYVHFGNKDELFDLVVAKALADMAAEVPFTADDLPGYAVRLFDHLRTHPHVLRLTTWAQLERPEPSPAEIEAYRPKVAAVAEAQAAGGITSPSDAVDLLALTIATATAWANASPALRSLAPDPPGSAQRLDRHRAALTRAQSAIVSSGHGGARAAAPAAD